MERTERRFRIIDGCVLTFACAIGFALARQVTTPDDAWRIVLTCRLMALSLTLALAIYTLWERNGLRDSTDSRGRLCVLLVVALSFLPALMKWNTATPMHGQLPSRLLEIYLGSSLLEPAVPACATVAGWITQKLARVDACRVDWIDRCGMLLGGFWILNALSLPQRPADVPLISVD